MEEDPIHHFRKIKIKNMTQTANDGRRHTVMSLKVFEWVFSTKKKRRKELHPAKQFGFKNIYSTAEANSGRNSPKKTTILVLA